MEKWSALPEELLNLILELLNLPDLFRFGCVCKPWRSVCGPLKVPNHLPWLIVPIGNNSSPCAMALDTTEKVGFYSLCDDKIYKANIPQLFNRRICSSFPGGWLMTVHENSQIQLFNPFSTTRPVHHLPPLTKFADVLGTEIDPNSPSNFFYFGIKWGTSSRFRLAAKPMRDIFIHKVAMSSSTITNGTVIMAIQGVGSSMAFYRFGATQDGWAMATPNQRHFNFTDITYYKGKFYAVHGNGYVIAIHGIDDVDTPYGEQIIPPHPGKMAWRYYILESSGDLLVVLRTYVEVGEKNPDIKLEYLPLKTVGFKVFKIEFGITDNKWVEIPNLGDRSIFLGYNTSFSLSAAHFSGCKPNHIYFADDVGYYFHDQPHGGHDFGVFNLEDGSVDKFIYPSDTVMVRPPPIWVSKRKKIASISGRRNLHHGGWSVGA